MSDRDNRCPLVVVGRLSGVVDGPLHDFFFARLLPSGESPTKRQQKLQTCKATGSKVHQGRPKAPHLGPRRQTPRPLCAPAPGAATESARPGTLIPVTTGKGGPLRVTQAGLSGAVRRARTRPEVVVSHLERQ